MFILLTVSLSKFCQEPLAILAEEVSMKIEGGFNTAYDAQASVATVHCAIDALSYLK
jgi:hypothetical protein